MTYAGADGETKKEMARVLSFPADEKALAASFAQIRTALESAAVRTATFMM